MPSNVAISDSDAWETNAERLAFGLYASKPRDQIVVLDLVFEADQLSINHTVLFDGLTDLKSRGMIKVMFTGRNATTAAVCEFDDEAFEPRFGPQDVATALTAYLDHPRPNIAKAA